MPYMSMSEPAVGREARATGVNRWKWLAIVLMMCHVAIAFSLRGAPGELDDFDRYWELASAEGRPYVSYEVEYAPVAPLFFQAVARVTDDRRGFRTAMVWAAAIADLVVALALARGFGWRASALYLVVVVPLLPLFYRRFDLLPTAAATIGMAAHRLGRPVIGAIALVIGIGFKLWPLPLVAALLRTGSPAVRYRTAIAVLVGLSMLGLGWLLIGGLDGITQVVTLRGATGWHLESTVGAIVAIWDHGSLRMESNAYRVGRTVPGMTLLLGVVALTTSLWLAWRGASSTSRLGTTWLASVSALLVCSPVLSPQYMAWIAPAAALTWVEGNHRPAVLAAGAMALTVLLMREYDALLDGGAWALTLVIMRNAALFLTFVAAAVVLARGRGNEPGTSVFRGPK
jgi:hypothetical protein